MKRILFTSLLTLLLNNFISAQWIEQQSGVATQLNAVFASHNYLGHAWICGDEGVVLRTTNNGTNWINVSSNLPVIYNFTSVIEINSVNVLIAGRNSGGSSLVYRTTNGGLNWNIVFTQSMVQFYGFASTGFLYLIGSPINGRWQIWRSTNFGTNWDSTGLRLYQSGSETGFINSVWGLDGRIWVGTNNSKIYYSPSQGVTWSSQSILPETESRTLAFAFVLTDAIGYGFSGGVNALKSSDQGSNWLSVNTPGSGNIITSTCGPGLNSNFWYTKSNKIYAGQNGDNFSLQYTVQNGNYKHMYAGYVSSNSVWAVRDNGGISKYTGEIGIQQISGEIPESFSLSQNYPNPFNPSTKIRFSIPLNSTVAQTFLSVYDILGREIATLVNEQLQPGTYSIEWNPSNHPSGLYFYTLKAGDYTETKKMILLK